MIDTAKPTSLSFQQFTQDADLSPFHHQEVSIRGFLYRSNGELILAPEPNLRSCCVGAAHTTHRQIKVLGLPSHTDLSTTAQVLHGTFIVDAHHQYLLRDATIENDVSSFLSLWAIIIGCCLVALWSKRHAIYRQI